MSLAGHDLSRSISENYLAFSREARGRSRPYEILAAEVAGDPLVLAFLAAAAAAFLPHDHRVEAAFIIGVQHLARKADRHGQRQLGGHHVQPLQQRHQFRSRGMVADPER